MDSFDPWRGFKFSTYACNVIYRAFARMVDHSKKNVATCTYKSELEKPIGITDAGLDLYIERMKLILEDERACLDRREKVVLRGRMQKDTLERIGLRMD